MDVLRQAKEAAVKSCSDQRREAESLTEQLSVVRERLASTKQQLQVDSLLMRTHCVKGKVFPYSLLSVGPRADPGVQAVSPQVT